MREWSPIERRLRRLAVLIPLFALSAAGFGMVPDGLELWSHSFKHSEDNWDGTMRAGGWALVAWGLLIVWASWSVRRRPSRARGVEWIAQLVAIYVVGGIAWLVENFRLERQVPRWPGHVTAFATGTATVLALVVLPIVLFASRGERPPDIPSARVSV